MSKIDIYVAPDTAETMPDGSTLTFRVESRKPVGKGMLLSGEGEIVVEEPAGPDRLSDPKTAGEQEFEDMMDLSGSVDMSKAVSTFVVSKKTETIAPEGETSEPATPPEQNSFAKPKAEEELEKIAESEVDLPVETKKKMADNPEQFAHKEETREPEQLELGLEIEQPAGKQEEDGAPKPKFGERGPQLIGMDQEEAPEVPDTPADTEGGETAKIPDVPAVSSVEEFFKFLETVDENDPAAQAPVRPVNREEAVRMERQGMLSMGPQMYILNTSPGQLVLSDIDVRMLHGDSLNLSRIPPARLKHSADLFEAISNNLVKFVTPQEASEYSRKTQHRLLAKERDIGGVEVYDSTDDIYDDIDDGWDDFDGPPRRSRGRSRGRRGEYDDDPMPRFDVEPQVRQMEPRQGSEEFRRGIRPKGRKANMYRRRPSDDYDEYDEYDEYDDYGDSRMRAASVHPPDRFRHMRQDNILRDSRSEMDMIYDDVERREQEINIARSNGEDPFVDDGPPPPSNRDMPPSGDDEYDFGRPRRPRGASRRQRDDRWEGDDFRRESYREDDDKHVRVSRISW